MHFHSSMTRIPAEAGRIAVNYNASRVRDKSKTLRIRRRDPHCKRSGDALPRPGVDNRNWSIANVTVTEGAKQTAGPYRPLAVPPRAGTLEKGCWQDSGGGCSREFSVSWHGSLHRDLWVVG